MNEVYIVDAVRTPMGRIGGSLAHVRPDDLAATALTALMSRQTHSTTTEIAGVVFGNSNGAGEENRNVARMALLLAGFPTSVPGASVNRLCGSGMEAVLQASREIAVGDGDLVIAGGVESMSRAPWVMAKPDRAFAREHQTMFSTTLGWRMTNPAMPSEWTVALGEGAEILADEFKITREEQDAFAVRSHERAATAWKSGAFEDELIQVPSADLRIDESVRPESSNEALARLRPAFRDNGTVTAGNSSPMNDGAAAMLLMSERAVNERGVTPLARIASRAVTAVEPQRYGVGPVEAAELALERAGIDWSELAVVELNEAFASQCLACLKSWPELDSSIVNPLGGAIALGHPIGASGARLITTLAHELRRNGGGWGLATMCIGVGQGIAVVLDAR